VGLLAPYAFDKIMGLPENMLDVGMTSPFLNPAKSGNMPAPGLIGPPVGNGSSSDFSSSLLCLFKFG